MKLINNSKRNYIAFDTILLAGEIKEVENNATAKILLAQPDVKEYVAKEDVEALKKELEQLKAEKAKTQEVKEIKVKKTAKKKAK